MASSSQQPEWEGGGVPDKMAGDWTAEELQAVLYSTEVEEAIQEVSYLILSKYYSLMSTGLPK